MRQLSLPGFFHGSRDQAEDGEEQPPHERHQEGAPVSVQVGHRVEEFLNDIGMDLARIDVDEADGWIGLGDVLESEAVHRCRLIHDIQDGVVVLQTKVVGDQFALLASGEHAEDSRGWCFVKQWEEVVDEAHPSVIGEGETLVECFTLVYSLCFSPPCSKPIRTRGVFTIRAPKSQHTGAHVKQVQARLSSTDVFTSRIHILQQRDLGLDKNDGGVGVQVPELG